MPEPVFLLLIMILTGLGVWTFLGQMNSGRFSLPKLRLPRLRPPGLPKRRRPKRARERAVRGDYEFEDDESGRFAAERSPFSAPGAFPLLQPLSTIEVEEDVAYEEEYLPANQVDFFANDGEPGPQRQASLASPGSAPAEYAQPHAYGEQPAVEGEPSQPQTSPVFEVAASEPDPNDIMSFFEKPVATTQLPETLREELETVTAAQLLAEARQLRALLQGRKQSA